MKRIRYARKQKAASRVSMDIPVFNSTSLTVSAIAGIFQVIKTIKAAEASIRALLIYFPKNVTESFFFSCSERFCLFDVRLWLATKDIISTVIRKRKMPITINWKT